MNKAGFLIATLLLFALTACDDRSQEVYVDQPGAAASQLDTSQFDTFRSNQAIDQVKAQLIQNPNDFNLLSRLADMYFEASQYFEAIQTYDLAIAVNPACADCYNDKGLATFYLGDPDAALVAMNKATELDPSLVNAWLSQGYLLVSTGKYQEAIAPLNKVKELAPGSTLALEADKFLAVASQAGQQ